MSQTDTLTLYALFNQINATHFAGVLPLPVLKWNSRLRSSAGRFIPGSRHPRSRTLAVLMLDGVLKRDCVIEVASYLLEEGESERHILDTVAHEMIHYWLWHRRRPYGHTPEFYAKMHEMGVSRYNPVPRVRPYKYLYRCPVCGKNFPARKRLGRVACLSCCKQYAGGKFDTRFSLVLADPVTPSL